MKTSQTLRLLLTAGLLASCGGGGGSPHVATIDDQCTLSLQYADGNSSGIGIPEGGNWSTGVSQRLSGCAIERLQTIRLDLCLKHPSPGDLEARIEGPGVTVTNLSGPSTVEDAVCSALDPQARVLKLSTSASSSMASLNGDWRVQVSDRQSGYGSGTLIRWSMRLDGLR